jgi:hypothetical protein
MSRVDKENARGLDLCRSQLSSQFRSLLVQLSRNALAYLCSSRLRRCLSGHPRLRDPYRLASVLSRGVEVTRVQQILSLHLCPATPHQAVLASEVLARGEALPAAAVPKAPRGDVQAGEALRVTPEGLPGEAQG